MFSAPGIPLNPFDSAPPARGGIPVVGGRFPKLGHLPAIVWNTPQFLRWAHRKYGSCMWVDRGFGSSILQLQGDAAFEILRNKNTDSSALYDVAATFLGRSMIVVDGADHRRMRGASAHAFTPGGLDRAKVGKIIAEVIAERVHQWPSQPQLPIARAARELALAVIFRIVGISAEDLPAWRHHFEELALSAVNLPWNFPGSPMRRGLRAQAWLNERVQGIVEQCREQGDDTSLVGAMVHGRDDKGQSQTDTELVDNIKLLVLAGHETTATVLAWAMLLLAEQPRQWDRLCEESLAFGRIPTSSADLQENRFAEGIFREALRLYPPVSSTIRKATKTMDFYGHEIEQGAVMSCNLHEISRDPKRYSQPNAFRPQRWLEMPRRPTQLETCQFGGGPHFCLGYHVAMLEGVAVLVAAAQSLAAARVRPTLLGAFPKALFVPLVHPPRKTAIALTPMGKRSATRTWA